MIIIACIDENGGMMFNHRRQSQDKVLRNNILEMARNNLLWMNPYTYNQFLELNSKNIVVDNNFLDKASFDDYCFVENENISNYINEINKIVLYKWNRKYPADFYLDLDIKNWKLIEIEEFEGNSHQKITKEIYIQ